MASDFNRQDRWKKEIGGQESDKALRPRSVRGAPRAGQENTASHAFSGESRLSEAVDPIETEPHRWLGVWI
ncbi:hypothetical protein ACWIE6_01780, partial [Paenibacillus taichungensis]